MVDNDQPRWLRSHPSDELRAELHALADQAHWTGIPLPFRDGKLETLIQATLDHLSPQTNAI